MSEEVKVTEEKKPGAKDVTLRAMIVASIWIGLLTIAKALWKVLFKADFGLTMQEILLSGVVMAAIFSPVYLSVILDKVKDIKIGG